MYLSSHNVPVLIVIFIIMIVILQSCQSVGGIPGASQSSAISAPDIDRLRARISEAHTALGAKDSARWYAMATPEIRAKMSLEEFKKDIRWEEKAAQGKTEKMDASLVRVCSCVQMRYLRCVLIVDVAIAGADDKAKRDLPLEMWEYASGEWYWGYIGANSQGRCPGER